jgi:hypothetical protein
MSHLKYKLIIKLKHSTDDFGELEREAPEIIHELVDCQVSTTNPELTSCDPSSDFDDVISSSNGNEVTPDPRSEACSPVTASGSTCSANNESQPAAPLICFDFITWMKCQERIGIPFNLFGDAAVQNQNTSSTGTFVLEHPQQVSLY